MFWIHNEFNKVFGEADRPYAKNMQILRNALEHKFVKVHADILWDGKENHELGQDSFYHQSAEEPAWRIKPNTSGRMFREYLLVRRSNTK